MLQLKTIHDARRHRALPSARLVAHSNSPLLAPRRAARDGAASGPGGGGCGAAARSCSGAARAGPGQGRAKLLKVAPPPTVEVEGHVRQEDGREVTSQPAAAFDGSDARVDEHAGPAAMADEAAGHAAAAPREEAVPLDDAPRRRPTRTISHDFELVLPGGSTVDGGVDTLAVCSPADEDEWEFLSLDQDDTVLAKPTLEAPSPASTAAGGARPPSTGA
ncbi:hypothetical protein JCM3775_003462 [Rhodotorula graminis]|uniref:Uncharacterized protein n=1 Tax=Rhodotorula graminis (strain WP1) TaxID=578459 RepID=A0A0P9F1U6_RHOGW|nr:uncharacterized protein RHOBADRAFT_45585 [Rhodotorula graminis WP1]KPV73624.1 hypothetical protein RHOBADRAFT_45585 [Rhodotorula graminis WP1]